MPIASAISGIEMPGRARTSSSACLARVPLPRGGPGRLLGGGPGPARAPGPAAAVAVTRGRRRAPRAASAPPRAARGGRRRRGVRAVAHAGQGGARRLEATVLLGQRAKLLQPRVDLTLLVLEEVGHMRHCTPTD